jgi:hypothetical protein
MKEMVPKLVLLGTLSRFRSGTEIGALRAPAPS